MHERPAPTADLVVVGGGAAGLYAAVRAAAAGAHVALLSGTPLQPSASSWAQGGVAAALGADDSPELHLADTVQAGRGLVRRSVAADLCRAAPGVVGDLEALGIAFDRTPGGTLALGLEGGHRRRRVVHAGGSQTGARITAGLAAHLERADAVQLLVGRRAAGLWCHDGDCVGVLCEDGSAVPARGVVLATGGAAALWARTTNPAGSVGTGMLMAAEAGAALADLEFTQFHPTAVAGHGRLDGFLVTEAIRGEGARLLDASGERFVGELEPRDAVSAAIWRRLRASGTNHVHLDMRQVDPAAFPNVVAALRSGGIEPTRDLVPVAPAAHYVMGGVVCDARGATGVPGLHVVGETACTGLHGANRLASNSLTECFALAAAATSALLDRAPAPTPSSPPPVPRRPPVTQATRRALWEHAGVERDAEGLTALLDDEHPLARAVARAALGRCESRGGHRRVDHPATDAGLDGHHSVQRDGATAFERWD